MIAQASFEITRWDEEVPFDAPEHGPSRARLHVDKAFSGQVHGTSKAELITCAPSETQAGYIASERLDVTIDGRSGTFVIQHGGIVDGQETTQFANVVPGSGTEDFAGIRGTAKYEHDEKGARFSIDYTLAGEPD